MPARKRHKKEPEHPDPLVRFGRALKEREAKEKAAAARRKAEREEARRQAILAAEHAAAVKRANKQLERAIAAVKTARTSHSGMDEADAAYREAKALVVELETGVAPSWAPNSGDDDLHDDAASGDHEASETS
jgi:hypothetical protein